MRIFGISTREALLLLAGCGVGAAVFFAGSFVVRSQATCSVAQAQRVLQSQNPFANVKAPNFGHWDLKKAIMGNGSGN